MRVVYIMGLGHSGTTFLQFLLASAGTAVGLGEVRHLAPGGKGHGDATVGCSCGEPVGRCSLWSGVERSTRERTAWHRHMLSTVARRYPDVDVCIDNSKTVHGLQPYLDLRAAGGEIDLRVIWLVRDVRGWIASNRKSRKRKGQRRMTVLELALRWAWGNRRLETFLRDGGIEHQLLSYEELVFDTARTLRTLREFLGFPSGWSAAAARLEDAEVHDVYGNRMKADPSTRGVIRYDGDWHLDWTVNFAMCVAYPVWRYNRVLRDRSRAAAS